ncbi:MAG: Do family serine endopeptidase [Clostridiales bacterium]|nr:Do family serine endopeptidase [Clostridiales bacterium]
MNKTVINTLGASLLLSMSALIACANSSVQPEVTTQVINNRAIDFTTAAESTVNGVVSIKSYNKSRQQQQRQEMIDDPFLEFFFGPQYRRQQPRSKQDEPAERQSGLGSGVILSSDGFIATNNHVVQGADRLEVTLNDNRTFDAEVIGTDPDTDIALVKIDADNLHVIPMGDSDDLRVGEWVLAVGNPFGLTSTVTAGIVSAKARNISNLTPGQGRRGIESYIQTDAAVNPGNSGGALVNLDGELVGINTAIFSQTGNYSGSSFAVPTSIVKKVITDIKEYGTVQRAFLGVQFAELTPQLAKEKNITSTNAGLCVMKVEQDGAAHSAGIIEGDVIIAIDGNKTDNSAQLQEAMARRRPGEKIVVTVVRDNKNLDVNVTLRNSRGDTGVTVAGDVSSLGCVIKSLSDKELKEMGRRSGVKVEKITDGKFKDAGIKEGFIIFDINNAPVSTADDVTDIYNAIVQSDEYDHVMFITGKYPKGRKQYYAVDLD